MPTKRSLQRLRRRLGLAEAGRLKNTTAFLTVLVALFFFAFPIYWITVSSFKPPADITSFPPELLPSRVTLENHLGVITDTKYLTWLKNSLIVTVGDVVLATSLATIAGYALTRYPIPYKTWIARSFILAYLFPPLTLGVPYFLLFDFLGLRDTLLGLVLAHTAVILPFTTWLMWQFFQTVPISREEAAWVYGAPQTRAMLEIAIPAAFPGIAASAIFAFSVGWSDFTFALVLIETSENQVMTLGIHSFLQSLEVYWGDLMAATVGLIGPPLIIVILLNKYMLTGFSLRS